MGTSVAALNAAPLAPSFTTVAVAQPPLPPGVGATTTSSTSTILKNVALYGSIGAAVGFGASFLTLPVIGAIAAPIAAAIGGAIGATIGFFVGRSKANKNTAAQLTVPTLPALTGQVVLNTPPPTSVSDSGSQPVAPQVVEPVATPIAPTARDTVRDQVLASFDKNSDGSITVATEIDASSALAYIARAADMNGDGTVSREELNDTLFNADTNKDGKLSSDELNALESATATPAATSTSTVPDAATSAPTDAPPVPTSLPADDAMSTQSPVPTQATTPVVTTV